MGLTTAVIQYSPNEDKERNLGIIESLIREAVTKGSRLVVLPEYAIYTVPTMDDRFVENAETLYGPCVEKISQLSAELKVAVIFGINEIAGNGRIHNTLIGMDSGKIISTYRKVHLYDAFGYKESDRVIAAEPNNGTIFEVEGNRIGMQTCYDLRFPETTRALVDQGATIIAVPAEWIPGPLKEYHWNTLIRSRAIENTVYVVASGQCAPTGAGHSAIIDPMGVPLATVGEAQGIAITNVNSQRIEDVRKINPAINLRRYKVIPKT